jgi:hypothetical protein
MDSVRSPHSTLTKAQKEELRLLEVSQVEIRTVKPDRVRFHASELFENFFSQLDHCCSQSVYQKKGAIFFLSTKEAATAALNSKSLNINSFYEYRTYDE